MKKRLPHDANARQHADGELTLILTLDSKQARFFRAACAFDEQSLDKGLRDGVELYVLSALCGTKDIDGKVRTAFRNEAAQVGEEGA